MVMQENYQPVVLRKLLLSKGVTRPEIEEELEKYNPESTSQSMTNTVLTVLQRERNNVIRKEGDRFVINSSHELSPVETKELVNACEKKIEEFKLNKKPTTKFFIALGPWSNWEHTINNPPFRWGVNPSSASNVGVFNALRPGDVVFYYANQDKPTPFSKRGLFGVGRVTRKYDEDGERYWPDEKLKDEIIYKHRFEIESLKLVKSDSEMLPWIEGLPFTKGLNRIANKATLKQLIDNTEKIWDIKLNSSETKYWKIAPGEAGEDWENQKSRGLIGIHFFDFDLTGLTEDELRDKISEKYGTAEVAKRANTFGQVRNFLSLNEGDIVVANSGKSKILGIGRVAGPYKFRKDEKYPHTFPVDWYDTTEGTIPKQEGWMATVSSLQKEEFEELTKQRIKYLLLRHSTSSVNQWRDDIGKKYHFGVAPNYTKLIPGSKTIWFDRDRSDDYYWGYGEVSRIEDDSENNFHAVFDHFNYFNDPKKLNPKTEDVLPKKGSLHAKEKIMNLSGWNVQNSILEITKDIYDEIVDGQEKPETFTDEKLSLLTLAEIKSGYAKISDELLIPEEKITEIITALASGRHVLLAGPIGTGKTRLAKMIPEIFWDKVGGYYSEDHTATADWSTQDVIGGIYPKMEGGKPVYDIQNGCVVDTVRKNWENDTDGGKRIPLKEPQKNPPYKGTWLIIDEFNRADIDKAFGQLFTSLRTRELKIPTDVKGVSYKNLKIPKDYRIIGTLNTADKHFLFQLSDALKSRFAYIEVDIPKQEQREKEIYYAIKNALDELDIDNFDKIVLDDKNKKINKEKSETDFYDRMMQAYYFLDTVRVFKKLGTAVLKLIYQNLIVGTIMTEDSKTSLDNALTSNLIPQLENLSVTFVAAINSMHSDELLTYLKDAYKSPNRQSYVESFEKILDYLEIKNKNLVSDFVNGNIKIEDEGVWNPIQTAYDAKKKEFEFELEQIKQSMDDLIKSMVI